MRVSLRVTRVAPGLTRPPASKSSRSTYNGEENEDRVDVRRFPLLETDGLFVGVYDGHGGSAAASAFLASHLCEELVAELKRNADTLGELPFVNAFHAVDASLYDHVLSRARECGLSDLRALKDASCKCAWYLENPCVCMRPPISANKGSTCTVVLTSKKRKVAWVANVGDSDAFVFTSSSCRQINTTDTPTTDENSEDFARIKRIATKRREVAEAEVRGALEEEADDAFTQSIDRCGDDDGATSSRPPPPKKRRIATRPTTICARAAKRARDGIVSNVVGNDRMNYVCLPGARSLNMTRAFGNFGHKTMEKTNDSSSALSNADDVDDFERRRMKKRSYSVDQDESAIVSTPHVHKIDIDRADELLIVASDGLWDNVEAEQVLKLKKEFYVFGEEGKFAELLFDRAFKSKRKPDDISVVVVSLK